MLSDGGSSGWQHRLAVAMRSLLGCCVLGCGMLGCGVALYQVGFAASVRDPIRGSATRQAVLASRRSPARSVPNPMLGAAGGVGEACLALVGGADRWLAHPRAVLAYGFVLAGLALSSLGLVLPQVVVLRFGVHGMPGVGRRLVRQCRTRSP